MRIALTASVILFGIAANAAYLAPWHPDDGGVCSVLPADGQGLALRVSPSGTDDFAAGFVAGDFADGAGWGGTAGQIVGGLIPIYGQLADARDTAANVRNVWNDPTSGEAWMGLAMSGAAWIPGVGDAAKGTYKGGRRVVSEVGEGVANRVSHVSSVPNSGARFSDDASALIKISKQARRGGVSKADAQTLLEWAHEYNVPAHGIERHLNRNFKDFHIHVGPVDHITITP